MLALLLVHWGMLPQPLLYLSGYFEQYRDEYYARLIAVSQRGEWRQWVWFFLSGVRDQARDALTRVRQLQDLREKWRAVLMAKKQVPARLLALVDQLFSTPVMTIPQVQARLQVTYPTAKQYILRLVDADVVKAADNAVYDRAFYAPDVLRVLEADS
jgi:Fic family protein